MKQRERVIQLVELAESLGLEVRGVYVPQPPPWDAIPMRPTIAGRITASPRQVLVFGQCEPGHIGLQVGHGDTAHRWDFHNACALHVAKAYLQKELGAPARDARR